MSSENIFEVLQNVAENTESSEKFLNILKENGFTGTLEEAENQINQQTQVVLDNLTTEDLQNIAGGKSLMNDKLKKALAVGGASLMAAGTVMPSSLAKTNNNTKKFADGTIDYIKKNPVHTAATGTLAVATILLSAKSIFGGKTVSGLPFTNPHRAFLWDKDLSENRAVIHFIEQLSGENCDFDIEGKTIEDRKIKFSKTEENVLKEKLINSEVPIPLSVVELLWILIQEMNKGNNKYIDSNNELTVEGAQVLNILALDTVEQINDVAFKKATADAQKKVNDAEGEVDKAQKAVNEAQETVKKAQSEDEKKTAGEALKQANDDLEAAKKKLEEAKEGLKAAEKEANNKKLAMPKKLFHKGDKIPKKPATGETL